MTATALTFGARVAAFSFAAITAIVLARWLSPSERGDYAVVTTLSALLVAGANLGLGQAHVHIVGRDPRRFGSAATNTIGFAVAVSLIVGAGTLALAAALRDAFPVVSGPVLAILVLSVPGGLLYPLLHGLLQARRDFRSTAAITVIAYAMPLATLAVLVGALQLGLEGALVAWLAAHAALALVTLAIAVRQGRPGAFDAELLWRALRLGGPSYAGSIALLVATRAALVVGGLALASSEVGAYAVGLALAELLWYVSESAAFGLAPFVAEAHLAGRTMTPIVNRTVLLLTAAMGAIVWILADPLVAFLFGTEYASAASALRWLLPGVVMYGGARVLAGDLAGRGRPEVSLAAFAVGAVLSLGLAAALVPSLGMAAGAAGTSVAYAATAVAMVVGYGRLTGVAWSDLIVPRVADLLLLRGLARRLL